VSRQHDNLGVQGSEERVHFRAMHLLELLTVLLIPDLVSIIHPHRPATFLVRLIKGTLFGPHAEHTWLHACLYFLQKMQNFGHKTSTTCSINKHKIN
jgi:hypothetical protein